MKATQRLKRRRELPPGQKYALQLERGDVVDVMESDMLLVIQHVTFADYKTGKVSVVCEMYEVDTFNKSTRWTHKFNMNEVVQLNPKLLERHLVKLYDHEAELKEMKEATRKTSLKWAEEKYAGRTRDKNTEQQNEWDELYAATVKHETMEEMIEEQQRLSWKKFMKDFSEHNKTSSGK